MSSPLIRTMLSMGNVVQIIISDIGHALYIKFILFSNWSKLEFDVQIWAFSKFLLRRLLIAEIAVCFAHFSLFEISTPVMSTMRTIANIV